MDKSTPFHAEDRTLPQYIFTFSTHSFISSIILLLPNNAPGEVNVPVLCVCVCVCVCLRGLFKQKQKMKIKNITLEMILSTALLIGTKLQPIYIVKPNTPIDLS